MLIITGTVAHDYIMDFPGKFSEHILKDKIHNINLSFIVDKFDRRRGGTAGNVSYSLGMLGIQHKLFTAAGKDFNEYKKDFDKLKIETKYIQVDKQKHTSTGFAMTDEKDNQIWGYYYGATENIQNMKLKTVAQKGDLVLIGPAGAKGSMAFVKQCIDLEISYMFDPGFILTQVSNDDLALGVKHADYLVGNDYEISLIQSKVPNYKTLVKNKIVITTLGEKGATIDQAEKKYMIKVVKAKKVVDPTGVGDAWRAGFLAGLEKNFDLQTCGQMGSVTAAFTIEHYGTQEHKFGKKEFVKRYKDAYNTNLEL